MQNKIILGAGIAGLGAWYANNEAEIYEMDEVAGGLCGQIEVNGFHFDKAVHLSFTKNTLVKGLFSETVIFTHYPIPKSWYHTQWLQHPAQNNLYPLPINEKIKAVASFVRRDTTLGGNNFRDWNRGRYGEYLWEHFFEPYNRKYWDIDLGVLGCDWIGNRIYQPSIEELLYGTYTDQTPNTYYAPEMRYPKSGGYFAFVKPIVDRLERAEKIHYGYKASKIILKDNIVCFENGESRKYNELYTSVPMPQLLEMIDNVPDTYKNVEIFDATGVAVVSIGLKKTNINQMWFYIYDDDILAARANMPSVKSPQNTPSGMASIQFEIYFNRKNKIPERYEAIENCLMAIKKMGIADLSDVLFTDYRVLPFGNVILKKGDKELASNVASWLNKNNIFPIGRFGRWEYLWSDQSFLSGYLEMKK